MTTLFSRSISAVMNEHARCAVVVAAGDALRQPLRRRADDAERVAHLVRDRRRELAERRELLALRQARARRGDRSICACSSAAARRSRRRARARVAEQKAEHGEGDAEVGDDQQVASWPLRAKLTPSQPHGQRVEENRAPEAGSETPPAAPSVRTAPRRASALASVVVAHPWALIGCNFGAARRGRRDIVSQRRGRFAMPGQIRLRRSSTVLLAAQRAEGVRLAGRCAGRTAATAATTSSRERLSRRWASAMRIAGAHRRPRGGE